MALNYLESHPFFHAKEYAELTGLSLTSARYELRKFVADEASGLGTSGKGTHIVYVKSN